MLALNYMQKLLESWPNTIKNYNEKGILHVNNKDQVRLKEV
jgi:hypothetical protein